MAGPTGIETALARGPTDGAIGLIAVNRAIGETAGWETSEFIEHDDEETSKDVFSIGQQHVSSWQTASPKEGEVVADLHLLSFDSIKLNKMTVGQTYVCVFTQMFRKRQANATQTDKIAASGFKITHHVTRTQTGFDYYTEKTASKVLATNPGTGGARWPAQGTVSVHRQV